MGVPGFAGFVLSGFVLVLLVLGVPGFVPGFVVLPGFLVFVTDRVFGDG